MDDTDRAILALLQEDARVANAEIARRVGLAPSAIFQRIRKLEDGGVIRGYHARLDPRAMDRSLVAFVQVRTADGARAEEAAAALGAVEEVTEVHRVVGEDCFFLKIRVKGTDELGDLLDRVLQPLPMVASTRTTIVLKTTKETLALPVGEGRSGLGMDGPRLTQQRSSTPEEDHASVA